MYSSYLIVIFVILGISETLSYPHNVDTENDYEELSDGTIERRGRKLFGWFKEGRYYNVKDGFFDCRTINYGSGKIFIGSKKPKLKIMRERCWEQGRNKWNKESSNDGNSVKYIPLPKSNLVTSTTKKPDAVSTTAKRPEPTTTTATKYEPTTTTARNPETRPTTTTISEHPCPVPSPGKPCYTPCCASQQTIIVTINDANGTLNMPGATLNDIKNYYTDRKLGTKYYRISTEASNVHDVNKL